MKFKTPVLHINITFGKEQPAVPEPLPAPRNEPCAENPTGEHQWESLYEYQHEPVAFCTNCFIPYDERTS